MRSLSTAATRDFASGETPIGPGRGRLRAAYLIACMLALESAVNEPAINEGYQGVALDVTGEREFAMRLLDMPFLLEFGGGFTVVCSDGGSMVSDRYRGVEAVIMRGVHILPSRRYLEQNCRVSSQKNNTGFRSVA